jgi:hypothetical protein
MLPASLNGKSFSRYMPQARQTAEKYLPVLQRLPLTVLPLFLNQLIKYDWLFTPERRELTRQLDFLGSLDTTTFDALMKPFNAIRLPDALVKSDWVNQPQHFSEQLSAFLWSSHQIDDYHRAANEMHAAVEQKMAQEAPSTQRCAMVVIGGGVTKTDLVLFRRLRQHGVLFTHVDPASGWQALTNNLKERAKQHPGEHAHWYIDGGDPDAEIAAAPGVSLVSYKRLAAGVRKELNLLDEYTNRPPETSTTHVEAEVAYMVDLKLSDLGLGAAGGDDALEHFQLDLLTGGSGTQVYSTTFVQWAARECLRRAQPLTLLARFTPRQQAATMNELLARDPFAQATDLEGSLVDADMGAYYTWINQGRLTGAEQSQFVAWFEDHNLAIAIGPAMPKGTVSQGATDLAHILTWSA